MFTSHHFVQSRSAAVLLLGLSISTLVSLSSFGCHAMVVKQHGHNQQQLIHPEVFSRKRTADPTTTAASVVTRRDAFVKSAAAAAALAVTGTASLTPVPANADAGGGSKLQLSDEELKEIIKSDLLDRQFLATGQITKSVYLPTATFTDEIDTYKLEQWITGTQKLFVGEKSSVRLLGDVMISPSKIEFRFDEDLMFRIPFRPIVSLSGTVVLTRDEETGYISSYREFWDQDVATVLKTAKFK